ncbi:HlyD family type I secretion periplasmic adaptor subunit [Mesorhizobium sp. ZC-5]|uniref:HlyD family type I secretion periplasmic adaptor subunit n=1 Tax=Mesorhizobium sp. ZC-5 TaxID=2986066 RepID=UPI0021E858AA|nr:HlyD family type I secretion periplasmic adaptor subunit [Mesorhizobium sp. ZC-5]MCV3238891.1 HlyD family type I secretion periplasmic adaptor subunit [Mesorhizobium sp. ZC-5]
MIERPPLFARLALAVIILLIGSFIAWSAVTEIDEITRGDGKVIPVSKTQIVQSTEPGVVQEIAVQVGQVVSKGDLIIRLDDTSTTASLGESVARSRALQTQIARLEIEMAGDFKSDLDCPEAIAKTSPQICENENQLLRARRDNFRNKLSVLEERRQQRMKELDEAHANISRLEENLKIAQREEDLIAPMAKRKLVAQTDLIRVQKELTEVTGQLQLAKESIDRIKAAISEASLQVDELGLQLQQEALAEKTQALSELSVIEETIRGASDRVARTDIRSPVDGVINTLDVNTIGAYVQPGSVIGGVVPTSETLLVEARVSPRDIAFVRPGQPALVKISAYDFSIYGGIEGEVSNITADSLVDQNSGETFYQVRVKTAKSELVKDGRTYAIIPGMIASVDIMTGHKTILHYLLKPINKAKDEALRER